MFISLAIVLPLGLGLALSSRTSVPASANAPRGDASAIAPDSAPASDTLAKSGALEFRLRIWNAAVNGARVLELTPKRDLESPDVLVYWADSEAAKDLPANSVLLGSLAGTQARRFTLSKDVHGGRLFLYSLAHQELVANLEFDR